MPVAFLTDEQAERYGRFNGEPTNEQLARHFHLDDTDLAHALRRRAPHNQLGFALQLCTVRFLGTFLQDPTSVPTNAAEFVANQLQLDASILPRYLDRATTRREHIAEIQRLYEYRGLYDDGEHFRLTRWLYTRAWLSSERPSVLFDLATARLVQRKVLLPGVTVLSRLVARVRERANARVWKLLARIPTASQERCLEELLTTRSNKYQSDLDRLRRSPTRVSGPSLVAALERLEEMRSLGMGTLSIENIPTSRVMALARHAASTWAQKIRDMGRERRIATLVAFAHVNESDGNRRCFGCLRPAHY